MDDDPQVVDAIERAIAEAMDILPTQWVLVVADADGIVHDIGSPDLPAWQRRGLLTWSGEAYTAEPLRAAGPDGDE